MYDVPAGVGHELLAAKGQGHGSDANAGLSVLMLHLLSTLNGERTVVVELDNAADQYAQSAVALVDFGLVVGTVFVFLLPYHAKHPPDGAHGALRTAARMADVLHIDGLSVPSNRLPGQQSSLINTTTFLDFPAAYKGVYRATNIPNIKQYSIFLAASKEMAGTSLMKKSADYPTWYSIAVRPPEMNNKAAATGTIAPKTSTGDKGGVKHNRAPGPYAQSNVALVDFGLVDRTVFVFLPPYHAKHLADGAHGALQRAARMANVLHIDGLSVLSNRLPGQQSSIMNTATFVGFPAAYKEVYRAKNIPNIKQYSIFAASK